MTENINKYALGFWSRIILDPEWSDHVSVTEHRMFGAVRELLRPVDDDRFEEATTTQLEEGNQIPDHAQTVDTEKRVRIRH